MTLVLQVVGGVMLTGAVAGVGYLFRVVIDLKSSYSALEAIVDVDRENNARAFVDMKAYLLAINSKLDRLVERHGYWRGRNTDQNGDDK